MKKWVIGALFPIGVMAGVAGWRAWEGSAATREPVLGIALMAVGAVLAISSLFLLPRMWR